MTQITTYPLRLPRALKKAVEKQSIESDSPFIFPSPHKPRRPIQSVKTAWRVTLRRADAPISRFTTYGTPFGLLRRAGMMRWEDRCQSGLRGELVEVIWV
jgi:hypothetical protein